MIEQNRKAENLCLFLVNSKKQVYGTSSSSLLAGRKLDGNVVLAGESYGRGELKVASKFSTKSPDLKGTTTDEVDGTVYDIVGWWKQVQRGDNAGQNYLSLCVTKLPPTLSAAEASLTLESFYDRLDRADWFCSFSDDYSVERHGKKVLARLKFIAQQRGSDFEGLLNAFRMHHFSGESWNTPRLDKPARPKPLFAQAEPRTSARNEQLELA